MKRKMQPNSNKRRRVQSPHIDVFLETVNPPPTDTQPETTFQLIYHIYLNMNEENVYSFNVFYGNVPEINEFSLQFDASAIVSLFGTLFKKKNYIKKDDLTKIKVERYKLKGHAEECSICMEAFRQNQKIRTLDCTHFFHCRCVDGWFLDYDDRCPVCRVEVIKRDGIGECL